MDTINTIEKQNTLLHYLKMGMCESVIIDGQKYVNVQYPNIGRNEKCPCGSGIKFKKCCIDKQGVRIITDTRTKN